MTILWENRKRNSGRERRVCEKFRLGNWPEAGLLRGTRGEQVLVNLLGVIVRRTRGP
jgi:hypothetical protein